MALTRSKPASIFTPEGNSLAVFIDVADGTLKLKDVFGDVELFSTLAGGAGLKLKDDALMTATLTEVVDKDNTPSILSISTGSVGIGTTTSTGLLNLFKPSAAVRLMINGDAGQNRLITYRTGGVQRIGLYVNNTAETGSNVGSDFAIRRYTDTGTLGGTPLFIKRSTGNVGVNTLTPATTLDVNGTANIAERLTIEADSTATAQSTAVIQNTTTNSGIALVPNGTGAITADIPDGTATGGNARGANAVDLQSARSAADRVASGNNSTIAGGSNNAANSNNSTIAGGVNNIAAGVGVFIGGGSNNIAGGNDNYQAIVGGQNNSIIAAGHSFVGGGLNNTISTFSGTGGVTIVGGASNNINGGIYGFIGGGVSNTVSTSYSTISGGQSNTASTGTHATVVGGQSNVSSGQHSVSGGFTNTASGFRSVAMGDDNTASGLRSVAMGRGNTASGNNSVALGGEGSVASGNSSFAIGGSVSASGEYSHVMGFDNIAEASRSFALGGGASAYLTGQLSLSQGKTGSGGAQNGNAQQSLLTAKREDILTTAATTVLSLDGTGTTNLIIPRGVNRAWNVTVKWVAVVTAISGTATGVTVGDYMVETNTFGFKRVGGTSSITAIGTSGTFGDASITGTALMTYTAGASQELSMVFTAPTFVGGGTITMRVVAKVELTENAW